MSVMFEVYYKCPSDPGREDRITERVVEQGGKLTEREIPQASTIGPVVLTFEFEEYDAARAAASALRQQGEHVEGPVDYGP